MLLDVVGQLVGRITSMGTSRNGRCERAGSVIAATGPCNTSMGTSRNGRCEHHRLILGRARTEQLQWGPPGMGGVRLCTAS